MVEGIFLAAGLLAGVLAGWYWATGRTRPAYDKQVAELKRRAKLAEMLRDELYTQIERKEREMVDLHKRAEDEHRAAAEMHARLETAEQTIHEQQTHLEDATSRFTDSLQALSSGLSEAINQSLLELANFQDVGKSLSMAIDAHTRAIGDMEARLLAAARQLKEWGASAGQELSTGQELSSEESIDQPSVATNEAVATGGTYQHTRVPLVRIVRR